MAAILRPYARLVTADAGKHKVPVLSDSGQLQINWQHPFANGLIGAYLPGISWHDYTGNSGPLGYVDLTNGSAACAGIPATTFEGPAVSNLAATGVSLCTKAGVIDPRIATWTGQIAFYVRFRQIAAATNGNWGLMYVQDGTHSAVGIQNTTTQPNQYTQYSGSYAGGTIGAVVPAGVHGFCCNMVPSAGTSTLWLDGVAYDTETGNSASTCTLASTFLSLTGFSDTSILAVYFWKRAFTIADAVQLETDPYGIFKPPIVSYFPLSQGVVAAPTYVGSGNSDSPGFEVRVRIRAQAYQTVLAATSSPVEALNYQMAKTPSTLFFPAVREDWLPRSANYTRVLESTTHSVLPVRAQPAAQTPTFLFFSGIQEDIPRRADYRNALASTTQPVITLNYQMAATPTSGFDTTVTDDRPMRADVIGTALRASTAPVQPRAPPAQATQTPSFWIQNPDCTLPDQV